jgi:hypothetical protein
MSVKATATSEDITVAQGVSAKIIEQVAYYFSPSNLQRDAFLATKLREGGGFVHATLLAGFPRVKAILEDTDAICNIIWNSSEFSCKGPAASYAFRHERPHFCVTPSFSIRRFPGVSTDSDSRHAHWSQELCGHKTR